MNEAINSETSSPVYGFLRTLFILGLLTNLALTFVPSMQMRAGGFLGFGGEEKLLSSYNMIQMLFNQGQVGLGIFLVGLFAVNIALAVLALTNPKRWVFVTAACITAFSLLLNLFSGSNESVKILSTPKTIGYIASALMLLGFFIKPPIQNRRY